MRRASLPVMRSAGFFAILMGGLVVLGWILDIAVLTSGIPGFQTMKVNTAILFLLAGCWLVRPAGWLPWVQGVFAFMLFIQTPLGVDFGVDNLLIPDTGSTMYPGRPAQPTAFAFMLMAIAMIRGGRFSQFLLHVVTLLGFVSILGYLTNEPDLYTLASATSMSVPAAVGLVVLSIGIAFRQPDLGLLGAFTGDGLGARFARRAAPRLVGFVLVSEIVRIWALDLGLSGAGFGSALQILAIVIFVLYLFRASAGQLDAAEAEIVDLNRTLERKVVDRTAELQRKNSQLLDFTHIISHNLRAPVANLMSLTTMIKATDDAAERAELEALCDPVIHNLRTTLDNLTEALKVQQTRDLATADLSLQAGVDTVVENLSGIFRSEHVRIETDFFEAPTVSFNPGYLDSILQNLIGNAIKYRHPDREPHIRLRSFRENGKVVLTVSDNSLGMDLARHGAKLFGFGKVFHPHPDAKGIGLYMTRNQMEALGGTISAESAPGEGTTFRLEFPASA